MIFNKKEKRGIFISLVLLFVLLIILFIFSKTTYFFSPEEAVSAVRIIPEMNLNEAGKILINIEIKEEVDNLFVGDLIDGSFDVDNFDPSDLIFPIYSKEEGVTFWWDSSLSPGNYVYSYDFTPLEEEISFNGKIGWEMGGVEYSSVISGDNLIQIEQGGVVENPTPSNSGSGGGGGGAVSYWTKTYSVDSEKLIEGYKEKFSSRERAKVIIDGEEHHVGVIQVSPNSVVINVSSKSQQAEIDLDSGKKFDVNEDGYYDIYVEVISVEGGKVDLSIIKIYEKVLPDSSNEVIDEEIKENEEEIKKDEGEEVYPFFKNNYFIYFLFGGIILLITLIIFFLNSKYKFLSKLFK